MHHRPLWQQNHHVVDGPAHAVLTEDNLALYYGAKVRIISDGGRPVVLPFRERHREQSQ